VNIKLQENKCNDEFYITDEEIVNNITTELDYKEYKEYETYYPVVIIDKL
jgi:hypothetical protein